MKKLLLMATAVLCVGLTMTSCSKDDDDNFKFGNNKEYPEATEYDVPGALKAFKFGGKYLTKISRNVSMSPLWWELKYPEQGGSLIGFQNIANGYIFQENENAYTRSGERFYDFEINSNGFITSYKRIRSGWGYTYNFSYYSGRLLTEIKITETIDGTNRGETIYRFDWNIMKPLRLSRIEKTSKWDGEQWYSPSTYDFTYKTQDNPSQQYPISIAVIFEDNLGLPLAMVGLLGDGPEILPYESSRLKYTVNKDGTIASEKIGSDIFTYTYK